MRWKTDKIAACARVIADKKKGSNGKKFMSEASPVVGWEWGKGGIAWRHALMLPFHNTRLWNHASSSWLVKCLHVGRFVVLLTVLCSFNVKLLLFGKQYKFLWDFLFIPQLQEEQKIYLWSVRRRKPKHSKCQAFLILSCDKQWSHLQMIDS